MMGAVADVYLMDGSGLMEAWKKPLIKAGKRMQMANIFVPTANIFLEDDGLLL